MMFFFPSERDLLRNELHFLVDACLNYDRAHFIYYISRTLTVLTHVLRFRCYTEIHFVELFSRIFMLSAYCSEREIRNRWKDLSIRTMKTLVGDDSKDEPVRNYPIQRVFIVPFREIDRIFEVLTSTI